MDNRSIYYIKTYEEDPARVEMGFDLTAFQPGLRNRLENKEERVYQSIFLDSEKAANWTIGEIDETKIIDRTWWTAFSHTYRHFRRVVPWVW